MELRYFIIRRLLLVIPTLIGLTIIVFALMWSLPPNFLTAQFVNPRAPNADYLRQLAAQQLGIGQPLPIAYFHYLVNTFSGQWGYMNTQFFRGPVLTGISIFFPNTVQLAIFATILAVIISIPLGTYIGSKPNSLADQAGRIFSLSGYAMPAFWLALMVQIVFGKNVIYGNPLGVFPIQGTFSTSSINLLNPPSWLVNNELGVAVSSPTHMIIFDALIHGDFPLAWNAFMHIVLPVITLTYGILAGILRFVRGGMIDASNQEYVKTARSKGVPERIIIKHHIRKNALIPTITIMGLLFASLLGGVVLIEDVFQYPGIGLFGINAVLGYQIYGVMATTLIFGVILIIANLIVDIVYAVMDPRIRY
ncbi:MAG: ABC transporter permease [Thermoplasmataceae archaeon]